MISSCARRRRMRSFCGWDRRAGEIEILLGLEILQDFSGSALTPRMTHLPYRIGFRSKFTGFDGAAGRAGSG